MSDALALATQIQDVLHETIAKKFGEIPTGDEGGYALPLTDVEEPLTFLEEVTTKIGVRDKVDFALDVAASSFFNADTGQYMVNGMPCDTYTMNALYENLTETYKLLSVEDPFNEEDFVSFAALSGHISETLRVGDDLTTTSKDRLLKAIESKSVDALIIKPNQIGTFTETIETMKCAREHGVRCIVSHRSGETLDDFIADLAYASASFGLKAGARGPKEREAKYERLLAIEKNIITL
jgi:enolase